MYDLYQNDKLQMGGYGNKQTLQTNNVHQMPKYDLYTLIVIFTFRQKNKHRAENKVGCNFLDAFRHFGKTTTQSDGNRFTL